jgi:hypothetical protein
MSTEPEPEEEWAAVERRGAHLVTAEERPFIIHGFNTSLMSFAADEASRPRARG